MLSRRAVLSATAGLSYSYTTSYRQQVVNIVTFALGAPVIDTIYIPYRRRQSTNDKQTTRNTVAYKRDRNVRSANKKPSCR